MAEIAAIFHWPLSDLRALEIDELLRWRELAVQTWNRMNSSAESDR